VFRDHEIAAGEDFVAAIRRSVESATVVLAVVGPRWLDARDGAGRRRLDAGDDFVRLEIELALAAAVPVVPVLVEGATMPAPAELPPSLAEFARCQAVELADRRWRSDADALIETLEARFAIGAGAVGGGRGASERSGALVRWVVDLVDLALQPTRLIARRQAGLASDLARAFAFLAGAIVAGHLLLLAAIDVDLLARGAPAEVALGVATWLVTGLLVGLLAAGVLIAALALAWRIAVRVAAFRRVAVIGAYVYGGAWLGVCAGLVLVVTAVHLIDPGWLGRTLDALHAAMAPSGAPVATPAMAALANAPMRAGATVLLVAGALLWTATALWCVAAWGAFRRSFAATRAEAWLATSLWLAALAAVVWLPLALV
jgi:hypothetical protein